MTTTVTEREGRHTELPWSWSGDPCDLVIWSAIPDHRICFMTSNGPNAANAALIVKAVNAHGDLVAALRDAREFVQMNFEELLASCCLMVDGKPDRSTIDHLDKAAIDDAEACLAKIDAALSKAGAS